MTDLAKTVETEISLRLALEDAQKSARERDMILREMNHRVKNLFAMVSGMVGLTARDSETPKEMAKQLRGRINALSEAHALIEMATSGQAGRLDSADFQSVAQTILTSMPKEPFGYRFCCTSSQQMLPNMGPLAKPRVNSTSNGNSQMTR